jgi:hypothetical protein
MGRRKMDDERRREADRQAAAKRALDPQVRADALRFVTEWIERQAQRAPLLFSPTIGAAIAAQPHEIWGLFLSRQHVMSASALTAGHAHCAFFFGAGAGAKPDGRTTAQGSLAF